jgi:NADH-quinone oxidoreductase subunit I
VYGLGLLQGLVVTARRLLMRKVTQGYPEVQPTLPPRSRGSFGFNTETCISCGLCVDACPNEVIRLEYSIGEKNKRQLERYTMNLGYCLFCGLCVEICPKDAVFFKTDFDLGCYRKDDTVFSWKPAPRPAAPAAGPAALAAAVPPQAEAKGGE